MLRRSLITFTAIAAAILVAGCANSPPVRFYRLTPQAAGSAAADGERAIVVGPFRLADYLDRPQIVTRDGANGIHMAELERWAEPLDAGFQRVVAANLAALLNSTRVLEFPTQGIAKPDARITGRVMHFDADAAGLAVLEVQWGVVDADGSPLAEARRSRYQAQAAGRDYAALVGALNETVLQFSEEAASALR